MFSVDIDVIRCHILKDLSPTKVVFPISGVLAQWNRIGRSSFSEDCVVCENFVLNGWVILYVWILNIGVNINRAHELTMFVL